MNSEQGVVLVILAIFILAITAGVALVVDNSRQEIAVQQLQAVSDAASLAGVKYLDGTESGWRNAKRAALDVVRNSKILAQTSGLTNLSLSSGKRDPLDPGTPYEFSEGEIGNVAVKIERGYNTTTPDASKPGGTRSIFQSLEVDGTETSAQNSTNTTAAPAILTLPSVLAANSLRVTLSLRSPSVTFARVFGHETSGDLQRISVAQNESPREECVAPIAVPACALMLDTRRFSAARYETENYNPRVQCEREMVASEADFENPARIDGVARSETYPRLPYLSVSELLAGEPPTLNAKAVPIRAVLGVPDDGSSGPANAGPGEVAEYIRKMATGGTGQCPTKVKIGSRFRPVDSLFKREGGIVNSQPGAYDFLNNRPLEQHLADLINDPKGQQGNPTFAQAFGTTTDPNNPPKPNYPFLRNIRPEHPDPWVELRLTWPLSSADDSVGSMNMSAMAGPTGGDWVNPMCHSELVAHPNDPQQARVKEVTIMVVAPGGEEDYCDLSALFNGVEQNSFPPLAQTTPTVVGFTKAYLYDFNINNLDEQFADSGGTPYFVDNNGNEIIDQNPYTSRDRRGAERHFRDANSRPLATSNYEKAKAQWDKCIEKKAKSEAKNYCSATSNESSKLDCCNCLSDYGKSKSPWKYCASHCPRFGEATACGPEPVDPRNWLNTTNNIVDNQSQSLLECFDTQSCRTLPTMQERKSCKDRCRLEIKGKPTNVTDEPSKTDKLWWSGSCFRLIDGRSSPLEGSVGLVHPLLIQNPADPAYIDRRHYWADPVRYHEELLLIADILGVSRYVEADGEFTKHFPTLSELESSSDPAQGLERAIGLLVAKLNEPSPFSKKKKISKLETWEELFELWIEQAHNADTYAKGEPLLEGADLPVTVSRSLARLIKFLGPGASMFGVSEAQILPVIENFPIELGEDLSGTAKLDKKQIYTLLKKLFKPLAYLQRRTGLSIPGQHCLPLKRDNQFPARDPNKWEQPKNRKAQFGCGGLRLRLSCEDSQTVISNTPQANRRPVLVN